MLLDLSAQIVLADIGVTYILKKILNSAFIDMNLV